MKLINEFKELVRSILFEVVCKECGDDNPYADPNQPDGSFVCATCRARNRIWGGKTTATKSAQSAQKPTGHDKWAAAYADNESEMKQIGYKETNPAYVLQDQLWKRLSIARVRTSHMDHRSIETEIDANVSVDKLDDVTKMLNDLGFQLATDVGSRGAGIKRIYRDDHGRAIKVWTRMLTHDKLMLRLAFYDDGSEV